MIDITRSIIYARGCWPSQSSTCGGESRLLQAPLLRYIIPCNAKNVMWLKSHSHRFGVDMLIGTCVCSA